MFIYDIAKPKLLLTEGLLGRNNLREVYEISPAATTDTFKNIILAD